MAGTTGLEPAASAVTGQRSNQLNYVPSLLIQRYAESSVFIGLSRTVHMVHWLPRTTQSDLNPVEIAHKPPVKTMAI